MWWQVDVVARPGGGIGSSLITHTITSVIDAKTTEYQRRCYQSRRTWPNTRCFDHCSRKTMTNPKGDLIDYCRANGLGTPSFETAAKGPEHSPIFATRIVMGDEVWGEGRARTKKDAERSAALMALDNLAAGTPITEGSTTAVAAVADEAIEDSAWPIFPEVLAEVLRVANSRVDVSKRGTAGADEVRQLSLELYKSLLDDLGH
jgi:ribonuclease III